MDILKDVISAVSLAVRVQSVYFRHTETERGSCDCQLSVIVLLYKPPTQYFTLKLSEICVFYILVIFQLVLNVSLTKVIGPLLVPIDTSSRINAILMPTNFI